MPPLARVVTNETCNHRCRFCNARRPRERGSVAAAAGVVRRIDEAIAGGARQIVLTGGEPTLRRDLPDLVARVARAGVTPIVETNGADIDPARARALAAAGLHTARVHMPAWGPALDRITGRHDAAALPGVVRALADSGVVVEGTVPLARENLDDALELPATLAAEALPIERLWIRPVLSAPDPTTVPEPSAMLRAAATLIVRARVHALEVTLDPATFVPPCAFERPARVASAYALSPGGAHRAGYVHEPACDDCRLVDRCPGRPQHRPDLTLRPITEDRLRRRLTVISSVPEQIERELVTHEIYRRPDGTTAPAAIVRIGFACNQACHFCFVSTHLPAPREALVHSAIDAIGAKRGILVLSGGEPTLSPALIDYVERGRAAGAQEIELQTNATRLGTTDLPQRLASAGVDIAFVSLHGATAATSDRVTAAPGTFVQTLAGLDALSRTSIRLRLNFVLCELNRTEFPAFVDLVAKRWPRAEVTVSFVGMSTDLVPRERWLVPRYRDVLDSVRRGMARGRVHGLEIGGFDSMCGLPLCLVPTTDARDAFWSLAKVPPGYDGGEFVKPAPCQGCVLQDRCFGLRRSYAQMYGWDELRPVTETTAPEPPTKDPS